jgi:hypothetical protein
LQEVGEMAEAVDAVVHRHAGQEQDAVVGCQHVAHHAGAV